MPRRLLRNSLNDFSNNYIPYVSSTNGLGNQPFTVNENSQKVDGRKVPYNGFAKNTNIPSNSSFKNIQKLDSAGISSLHVESFNKSNPALQVDEQELRSSAAREHHQFYHHPVSTVSDYNRNLKNGDKKRKGSALPGTIAQNQKKFKDITNGFTLSNSSANTIQKLDSARTSSLHVESFNKSNPVLQVDEQELHSSAACEHHQFYHHPVSTVTDYNRNLKNSDKKRKCSAFFGTITHNQKKIKDTTNGLNPIQDQHNIHPISESNVIYKNDDAKYGEQKHTIPTMCKNGVHTQKRHKDIHIKKGSYGAQVCDSTGRTTKGYEPYENTSMYANHIQQTDGLTKTSSPEPAQNHRIQNNLVNNHMCSSSTTTYSQDSSDSKGKTTSFKSTIMESMHHSGFIPTTRAAHESYSTAPVENHQTYKNLINDHICNNTTTPHNQDVSHLYIDIGDCDYACEHCNAAFWYSERLKGHDQFNKVKYNKCCVDGKVYLQKELEPPMYFKQLFKEKHFLDNIRAYNQMFSMTSFGAEIDESINDGRGPYVFKISGQIHHWIGTICPTNKDDPKFMQLYIYDTENEVANRMKPFGGKDRSGLKPEIVQNLIQILDEHNELVQIFRTARDKCNEDDVTEFKIQLYNVIGNREYQLPCSGTLGAIVFESSTNSRTDYGVIIEYKDKGPQRINKLHSSYMSLQYPFLFVYGQPGFNTKMTLKGVNANKKRNKLSMNMYYKYQLHERFDQYGLLFKAGRLFQQYLVSVYCAIEQDRLDFIRANQNKLRSECLSGICDAISKGDHLGNQIGQKIILPSSFTGGPRYMYSHYLDALAICRVLGNPQYFITFTCNVNWPEIKRHMKRYPEVTQADRPDVVCRVFEEKLKEFLKVLKEGHIFGRCTGDAKDKIKAPEEVENFISAELPDKVSDPEAYRVVADMMMHGPCGNAKPNAPCMQEGECTKNFPKKYNDTTYFDKDGHIQYRRRRTSAYNPKGELKLDNSYVVPYNRMLCLMFHAHINVEYCGWSMLIKYLFKYISKGTDRIAARIVRPIGDPGPSSSVPKIRIDEIKNFIDGRFLCPHESYWRILDFPIHHREPPVQILAVHLKDMQQITFGEKDPLRRTVTDDGRKLTTLTQWFAYNASFTDGRHLTYLDFPSEYAWYEETKTWKRRKFKTRYSIGRLVYVHPAAGELFYFRMLLTHQKGCRSFIEVRTVNNRIFPTYRAACQAMGLLEDDREWDITLEEASTRASSSELRMLFSHMLIYCEVSNPLQLWEKHWHSMADDIPQKASQSSGIKNLHVNDPDVKSFIDAWFCNLTAGFTSQGISRGLQPHQAVYLTDVV